MILFVLFAAAFALVLEKLLIGRDLQDLRGDQWPDKRLAEPDEEFDICIRTENRSRRFVLFLRVSTTFPKDVVPRPGLSGVTRDVWGNFGVTFSAWLRPWQRLERKIPVTVSRRGRYVLRPLTLTGGDFLGLKEQTKDCDRFSEVVVPPREAPMDGFREMFGGFMGQVSVNRFILEDPVLTLGAREYTGREPMKSISWPQSARCGHLVVKQYDHTVDLSVTVLLNAEGGTSGQLEQCFSMTRTVCETLESKGIPYDLRTNADLIGPMGTLHHISQGLGRRHLNTILYGLGRSFCRCVQPLDELVGQCRAAQNANRSYVVVSPPLSGEQRLALQTLRAGGVAMTIFIGEEEDQ